MSDPRSFDTPDDAAGAAPDTGADDGRLVLTPALRVSAGAAGPPTAVPAKTDDAATQADDAALRALVREILREELAGQFGERITRGTRRLVRAEVATLLAARDPD